MPVPAACFPCSSVALGKSQIPPSLIKKKKKKKDFIFASLTFWWKVGVIAPTFEITVGINNLIPESRASQAPLYRRPIRQPGEAHACLLRILFLNA